MNAPSVTLRDMARTQGSHSDITGPRIRDAALHLFARHGYAAVSMRQIAAEVGVQAGALYNYIPDKQTLLFELMQGHLSDLLAAIATRPKAADTLSGLEDFTRFHISFHLARPESVFIAYMELRNLTPQNFSTIEELRQRYEGHLEAILERGIAEGSLSTPDPKLATRAVIAMLNGVNTWFRPDGRLTLDQVVAIYWGMVRKALGG